MKNQNLQIDAIEKESIFGTAPVLTREKQYSFPVAFCFLASYGIATWNYTQGAYIATLVGFQGLLFTTIIGSLFMMLVMELPVILATRYGIDFWVWMKAVLGPTGVKLATILIVLLCFPWHAVCADMFASSMENLLALGGIHLPDFFHPVLGILCVLLGGLVAFSGLSAINKTTMLLTPLLILVGIVVLVVALLGVPIQAIVSYTPPAVQDGTLDPKIGYTLALNGMFSFSLGWLGGMAGVPRLARTERGGFWAGVLGQGITGGLFVTIGAIMGISMNYATGVMESDPTVMLSTLAFPALALCSLILVGFANVGTQATGSYLYAVMLKTSFRNARYRTLVGILCLYVCILCVWGKLIDYLGAFLTIGGCLYAPIASLLAVDFFIIRKQKLSLRSAFEVENHSSYHYTGGFNLVGIASLLVGVATSLCIYDPLADVVHIPQLFPLTPTVCAYISTGLCYYLLNQIPAVRRYTLADQKEQASR